MRKITIAGTGSVGLSNAVLLAQHNEVTAFDILPEKVELINKRRSSLVDKELEEYLAEKELNLKATANAKEAFLGAEFVIISPPTNYDPGKNYFDTSSVEQVIRQVLEYAPKAIMVIKSTVPVGYTKSIRGTFETDQICFLRSFLGKAMHFMIICGRPGLLSASSQSVPECLPASWRKER